MTFNQEPTPPAAWPYIVAVFMFALVLCVVHFVHSHQSVILGGLL